jgi:hypothetical protein
MAAEQFILAHLNFGGRGEIRNVVLGGANTAPQAPLAGAIYFNTVLGRVEYFDGANWQTLAAEVFTSEAHDAHDHSNVASSIALNEIGEPTGSVSFAGQRITNVGTPSDSGDAANKSYVDAGLSSEASARTAAVASETAARESADAALTSAVASAVAAVSTEAAAREDADDALDTRVSTIEDSLAGLDAGFASEADLANAVAAEAAARQAADSDLADDIASVQTNVSLEAGDRIAGDTALQAAVDAVDAAVVAEASRAAGAESALDARLYNVEVDIASLDATYATDAQVTSAVAAEATLRSDADAALASDVAAVDAAVTAEAARATAAEATLAGQVSDEATARANEDAVLDARVTLVEDTLPTLAVAATVAADIAAAQAAAEQFAAEGVAFAEESAKSYADALVQGLDIKASVKVATTQALLVSSQGALEWDIDKSASANFSIAFREAGSATSAPTAWVQTQVYTGSGFEEISDEMFATNLQNGLLSFLNWPSVVTVTGTETFHVSFTTERNLEAAISMPSGWVPDNSVLVVNASPIVGNPAPEFFSGLAAIDGVALSEGDRVLVKNENIASNNGIWVASAGTWSRAFDADLGEVTYGSFAFVEAGNTFGSTGWVFRKGQFSSPDSWTQFSGAGTYVGGTGIAVVGNTITSMLQTGPGLQGNGANISLNLESESGLVTASDPATPGIPGKLTLDPLATRTHIGATTKVAETIGDGSATSFVISHTLGSDVVVTVRDAATGDVVLCGVSISNNTVTVEFVSAPAVEAYRVVVIG